MKNLILIFLCLFAAVVVTRAPVTGAGAGNAAEAPVQYILHNGDIRAMCRVGDSLWVGTSGGLYLYDLGRSEFAAHLSIGPSLPDNSVRAIASRNDTVFVGTDSGLSLFHSGTVDVFTPAHPGPYSGAPLDRIRRIDFGVGGRVYIATYGHGLGVLTNGSSHAITREDSLLDDKVYGMVQEDDTTFYYATSMGLCAFRDSVWVNFQAGAGIPRAEIRQIVPAPEGGYYLLVAGRGVYLFDGERARRVTYRDLFPENEIAAIAVDEWNSLWACGRHGGIAAYRNGHWTEVEADESAYGKRRWRTACADTLGNVFFGSADGRILSIRDNVLGDFDLPSGLPSGRVSAFAADSNGFVYALNGSYLLRFTDGLGAFSIEHPLPVVIGIAVSPEGELWTATRWGLYRRRGDKYVEFTQRPEMREPVFSAIGFEATGDLWAGTADGAVHRFDGLIWMRLADPGKLGIGNVAAFRSSPGAGIWMVGEAGGVARYRGGRWVSFGPPAFGESPAVDLAVSPKGIPVVATEKNIWGYDEINGWKPIVFAISRGDTTIGTGWEPGAPPIRSVRFDGDGRLYVGTTNGVAIVGPDGVRWLTVGEGLHGTEVTSMLVDHGRVLWVGFRSDGITRVALDNAVGF